MVALGLGIGIGVLVRDASYYKPGNEYAPPALRKILVGTWTGSRSALEFHEDGTFAETILGKRYPGEKGFFKGEFVPVRSGVFIRYFGSRHFPKEGQHRDGHTSIGSTYLWLPDPTVLMRNEEDIFAMWRKE